MDISFGSIGVEREPCATFGDGPCNAGGAVGTGTFGVVDMPMGNVSSASVIRMSLPWDLIVAGATCDGGVGVVAGVVANWGTVCPSSTSVTKVICVGGGACVGGWRSWLVGAAGAGGMVVASGSSSSGTRSKSMTLILYIVCSLRLSGSKSW